MARPRPSSTISARSSFWLRDQSRGRRSSAAKYRVCGERVERGERGLVREGGAARQSTGSAGSVSKQWGEWIGEAGHEGEAEQVRWMGQ